MPIVAHRPQFPRRSSPCHARPFALPHGKMFGFLSWLFGGAPVSACARLGRAARAPLRSAPARPSARQRPSLPHSVLERRRYYDLRGARDARSRSSAHRARVSAAPLNRPQATAEEVPVICAGMLRPGTVDLRAVRNETGLAKAVVAELRAVMPPKAVENAHVATIVLKRIPSSDVGASSAAMPAAWSRATCRRT